jgi:hypothetical protein
MHVIGHQYVGAQLHHGFPQRLADPMQSGVKVLLREEARREFVAALHDVQRQAVEADTGAARHGQAMAPESNSTLTPLASRQTPTTRNSAARSPLRLEGDGAIFYDPNRDSRCGGE